MRTQFVKGLGAAVVVGALAVVSAPAHAADVHGNVPFGFNVGAKAFPPGRYTASSGFVGALLVRGLSNAAFAGSIRVSGKNNGAKFVFHRYGDLYVLREVWMGEGTGFRLPETRGEGEAIRTARNGKASARLERVEVPIP